MTLNGTKKILAALAIGFSLVGGFAVTATAADANSNELIAADVLEMEFDMDAEANHDEHYQPLYDCHARNARGRTFHAQGRRPQRVQHRAMQQCYDAGSRYCYSLGCHQVH